VVQTFSPVAKFNSMIHAVTDITLNFVCQSGLGSSDAEASTVMPARRRTGQIWANSRQMRWVVESLAQLSPLPTMNPGRMKLLTKRERDVIRLVAEGLINMGYRSRIESPRTYGQKLSLPHV
jgi:hypothetical protein